MAEITYTKVPGKLKDLLTKIRTMGVPPKATNPWLQSIGFKSSNDSSMLPVLRQIGLIGQGGEPTQTWQDYRGKDHQSVLARCIKTGYADLFQTYPDAPTRSNKDLEHFFASKTKAGQVAIGMTVNTFKMLCQLADFGGGVEVEEVEFEDDAEEPVSERKGGKPEVKRRSAGGSTININIQLTLPETTDESVYEKFFAAMKKHLLVGD
jgi:hypothetical protein